MLRTAALLTDSSSTHTHTQNHICFHHSDCPTYTVCSAHSACSLTLLTLLALLNLLFFCFSTLVVIITRVRVNFSFSLLFAFSPFSFSVSCLFFPFSISLFHFPFSLFLLAFCILFPLFSFPFSLFPSSPSSLFSSSLLAFFPSSFFSFPLAPCCFSCNGGWCGYLAWLPLLRHRLKRTKWTNVYWLSHAKLSEVTLRISTDTCAQNHPHGHGNSSSWSQQILLWLFSDCNGGRKLSVNPRPRGHFFLPFEVASLVCLTSWTVVERPHISHIRGCACWCLICRDLITCYS